LQLFLWGLVKKVVIADRLALIVDAAYSQTSFASPADLLVATYLFAFQLYCDFSGYSDMAIGAAKVLGFDLMENFRRPYLSATVSEFWSTRWHVSLATWFRDYVYIPLGGSRVSSARWAFNVMAVFLLSGFWHGAAWTFIVWGGLNGVYVVISTLLRRTRRPASPSSTWGPALAGPDVSTGPMAAVRALATFHFVLVTWVFFRAASIEEAITVLTRVASSATRLPALVWARLASPEVATAVALVAVLMAIEWIDERRPMWQRLSGTATVVRWSAYYALAIALLVLGVWNAQQFVYMQF
jgi:D-alanyl-lipoteichoic acid acyltransferase DltB (MBOAT superfamily)